MDATTILIIAVIAAGVLVAAGVLAVAWRRGPGAAPIIGEFDKAAAKRDVSAKVEAKHDATAAAETTVVEPDETTAHEEHEPIAITDSRQKLTEREYGVTRRKFLNRAALGLFGGGFIGTLGISMLAFFWPKLRGGFGSKVNLGLLSDLRSKVVPGDGTIHPLFVPEGQTWLVPIAAKDLPGSSFEGLPVVVGAEGDEPGLMALWQKCVHLGCRVPDCPSSQGFECPCHGSKYNYHGEYEQGPAPRNLDRFTVSVDSAGNMIADTGSVISTPRASHKTIKYPQGPSCL
jgi:cytochrome b6-f complex iron-sulfur subunit